MNNERTLVLVDEDGKEINAEIIFTVHSDEFNCDYVVCVIDGNDEAVAFRYIPKDATSGKLEAIVQQAEWDFIESVYEDYLENNKDDEE